MKRMLAAWLLSATLVSFTATRAWALITIDFEGSPNDPEYREHVYDTDNDPLIPVTLGGHYPGVTFLTEAFILNGDISNGGAEDRYPMTAYPPHSGKAVLHTWRFPGPTYIEFDDPVNYVEGWFTFGENTGYIEAYDASGALIGSDSAGSKLYSAELLSVSAPGIKKIAIRHTGYNSWNWTADDIAYGTQSVPDPVGTGLLLGLGATAVLSLARSKRRVW